VALTDEGVFGVGAVSPDGHTLAMVVGDQLLVVDVVGNAAPHAVPGTFADESVCGWYAGAPRCSCAASRHRSPSDAST
jgi:hypothetical protein